MSKTQYGGQAVIEGVMMRGKSHVAIAVRKEDGQIVLDRRKLKVLSDKFKFLKWPIIRGVVALFQSLILGLQALTFSANQFSEEEEELTFWELISSMGVSFGLAIGLFVALPALLVSFLENNITSVLLLNLSEGIIKISFFLIYIVAISRLEDIKRVFQYHGAEHKVIHNYESKLPLTPENAQKFSTLHPRCGTNFLLIVMMMSVLLFSFFGKPTLVNRILIHIALLPVVAGLSYELIKQAGKKKVNRLFKLVALPGLYLQKLTTKEPSLEQLEVAIKSLETVLEEEREVV
ncbi:uncharacterized protein YqhQ [Orenia metallireducens]|jgi:uncharacterized protein YqhQ|uniref:Uncharacterized conserved protein YqhQ n=1 Tax=Orenia metallireducens TaxID=1413210 RepID=A0A285GNF5_9FIRM|nr:DUF1385 domain-containing protein [Orenia metallireducens]PRX35778.1 uncharacterized protein YqhQ [Orenia metallireducens]SNY24036.1 Uncharacterized conserved protein YqhQ [Orenia metallireducens]